MPTVLVIDENRATLETIGRALRTARFSVALASTGREGLRLATRRSVDLVVADLRLSDITGIEVLRQLRQALDDVPVIVTGLTSTASAIEAGKLGADYLEKPVSADHLVQVIRAYAPTGARSVQVEPVGRRTSAQLHHVLRAIEQRYVDTTLHVRSLANDLGISTEHLCRVVKRHTGETFSTLLRRTRVRAACRLLETTMLSMKEIAGRVGFSSPSRFDRDFKHVCGTPPTAYRAGSRRQPPPIHQ